MALTDTKVKNKRSGEKQEKLSDGDGMYLLVTPAGGKCWRLKYRFGGKEKVLALGTYPEVSLLEAREKRDAARRQLAKGIDPGAAKKAQKAAQLEGTENCFEVVAREWHAKYYHTWAESYRDLPLRRLELNVFPAIGAQPIATLTAPEVLKVLRRIEARGALETAHRVMIICGQVFRYAVATGRAERDPTRDLKGALPPRRKKHHAAITEPGGVGELLRAIDGYHGTSTVKAALQLSPLVFVRPGELRHAEWAEFDLDKGLWTIPGARMKMKADHIIPLSTQAVTILTGLKAINGRSRFVFPCARSLARPMSNNAVLAALHRMGFKDEMTGHGFRATARTIIDEELEERPDFIEHQLAHAVKDPNGRAYNRTAHLAARRKMMQAWADYLDGLRQEKSLPGEGEASVAALNIPATSSL